MCGASSQQTALGDAQTAFYNQMTQEQSASYAQNQEILKSLNASFAPILAGGINQQGFSAPELSNLNSQAETGTGEDYKQANAALSNQEATEGGGTSYIPSGAKNQEHEELASSGAQEESNLSSNILGADYATGRQNYLTAASGLEGVAAGFDPTAYSNAATGAGSAASTTENEITQANQSWMQLVSAGLGAAGSVAGAEIGK